MQLTIDSKLQILLWPAQHIQEESFVASKKEEVETGCYNASQATVWKSVPLPEKEDHSMMRLFAAVQAIITDCHESKFYEEARRVMSKDTETHEIQQKARELADMHIVMLCCQFFTEELAIGVCCF